MRTLRTVAVTTAQGKTYEHTARTDGKLIIIDGSPGRWTLDTFMRSAGPLAIDVGQGWVLENAEEIRAELETNDVTDEQIRALRTEAGAAGDLLMVATCDVAIYGPTSLLDWKSRDDARAECARVIADAAAQAD